MSKHTGERKKWDALTEDEKRSGKWVRMIHAARVPMTQEAKRKLRNKRKAERARRREGRWKRAA